MAIKTIITPISKGGVVNPASILVEQSELGIFAKQVWQFILYAFALIGLGTVLGWMV